MYIETRDGYGLLELNRPPVNALDFAAVQSLLTAFSQYEQDQPLIVTGKGRVFCAGVDTVAYGAYSAEERRGFFRAITEMTDALYSLRVPVVAAINGHALGGGLVLAMCTDHRIVAEGMHRFGLTEALAGVPFPEGPLEIVKQEIPAPLLRNMTLSSQIVTPKTLIEHAVFDEVASDDQLLPLAIKRARALAEQPAFSAVKAQIRGPLLGFDKTKRIG
ncbi:MAG: enoyl-CoA hydratase/isomerase family protein [Alphaproteobacteria bacterium]|nr:enoyl-CoA hydratase/isomerase family protein [Alphaproteobacteria bacterium]MBO6627802.1 enoyl-CoA hydratase/isomerase family protein [Alphaproteobacteria bacterium]